MPIHRSVEEYFEKFLDPDPEADDFQNLISSSLCTDTSVIKVFFVKIRSVVFTKVANRQTDNTPGIT